MVFFDNTGAAKTASKRRQTEDFKVAKMLNKKLLYETDKNKNLLNNLCDPYKIDAATVISATKITYLFKMGPSLD